MTVKDDRAWLAANGYDAEPVAEVVHGLQKREQGGWRADGFPLVVFADDRLCKAVNAKRAEAVAGLQVFEATHDAPVLFVAESEFKAVALAVGWFKARPQFPEMRTAGPAPE